MGTTLIYKYGSGAELPCLNSPFPGNWTFTYVKPVHETRLQLG